MQNIIYCNFHFRFKNDQLLIPNILDSYTATGYYKSKVKFALEQATKAQKGSRNIALLFL